MTFKPAPALCAALMLALAACGPQKGVGFEHYNVHSQSDPKPVDEDAEWEQLKRERGIVTPVVE
mgnify:CR=1 FL=1